MLFTAYPYLPHQWKGTFTIVLDYQRKLLQEITFLSTIFTIVSVVYFYFQLQHKIINWHYFSHPCFGLSYLLHDFFHWKKEWAEFEPWTSWSSCMRVTSRPRNPHPRNYFIIKVVAIAIKAACDLKNLTNSLHWQFCTTLKWHLLIGKHFSLHSCILKFQQGKNQTGDGNKAGPFG